MKPIDAVVSCSVVKIIELCVREGSGTDADPVRMVVYNFYPDGRLIRRHDPIIEIDSDERSPVN